MSEAAAKATVETTGPRKIKPAELKYHPLCEIFPKLEGAALTSFKEDIRNNTQRMPVMLYKGEVLDGRNRVEACRELFRDVICEDLPDHTNPVAYVISANLARRHLNETQRALIAAKLITTKLGDNQHKGGTVITTANAAKMLNVSETLVKTAKAVQEKATDDIRAKVEAGKLRLDAVKDIIDKPKEQQQSELDRINEDRKKRAKATRDARAANTQGQSKPNAAFAALEDFKKKWQGFDAVTRRSFVIAFKNEIADVLAQVQQQEAMIGGGSPDLTTQAAA
jgi:hypothetical protein